MHVLIDVLIALQWNVIITISCGERESIHYIYNVGDELMTFNGKFVKLIGSNVAF